jgi:DNA polymerase-3 subunit delta'
MGFKDIIGQETAKKILQSQIESNRVGTSYIFYGPEGVGKTLTASTFAKAVNCEGNRIDSCDKCKSCIEIDKRLDLKRLDLRLKNPDFWFITTEAGKNSIGIDQIKNIKVHTSYHTAELRHRFIIIKKADALTEEAANAFLKTLEEAPHNTTFILTTTKINAIIPTVKSRCHQIQFRRLKPAEIEKLVPAATKLVLELANGSVTQARKYMDPNINEIRNKAIEFLNNPPLHRVKIIAKLEEEVRPQEVRPQEVRPQIEEFLLFLQELYMDLLRITIGVGELIKNKDFEFKKRLQVLDILKAITICDKAFYSVSHNVHKKLITYWLAKELP